MATPAEYWLISTWRLERMAQLRKEQRLASRERRDEHEAPRERLTRYSRRPLSG